MNLYGSDVNDMRCCLTVLMVIICIILLNGCSYRQAPCADVKIPYELHEKRTEQHSYNETNCTSRNYRAEGGYLSEYGNVEYDWTAVYGLFYPDGTPIKNTTRRFYMKNYDDRIGRFVVRINLWDNESLPVDTFDYLAVYLAPNEIKHGNLSYSSLWQNRSGKAYSFSVQLEIPKIEECANITRNRTITTYINVTKYRTENICNETSRWKSARVI